MRTFPSRLAPDVTAAGFETLRARLAAYAAAVPTPSSDTEMPCLTPLHD